MDVGTNSSGSSEYHAVSNICSWESQNTGYYRDIIFFSRCSSPPLFCLFVCLQWIMATWIQECSLPFLRALHIFFYKEKTEFVASLFYLCMGKKMKALSQAVSEHLISAVFRSCQWQHYLVPWHWVGLHLGRRLLTMSWFLVIFYVQLFAVCIWLQLRQVPDLHLPGYTTKMWRIFQHYSISIYILKYKTQRLLSCYLQSVYSIPSEKNQQFDTEVILKLTLRTDLQKCYEPRPSNITKDIHNLSSRCRMRLQRQTSTSAQAGREACDLPHRIRSAGGCLLAILQQAFFLQLPSHA